MTKILVTDDSKLARAMLSALLKEHFPDTYVLIEAKDGAQAVELFKQQRPNYCFMDITMPVLNGIDALKEIMAEDPNAKVIMLTADVQNSSIEMAKEIGACYFIKKPIDAEKVKQAIDEVCVS